ncbi:MAG: tryptophan synthase subunit alpha, partial [Treponema porcinum]|nr:tryptophan synthase subunit alpha [Treponema porcinum]
ADVGVKGMIIPDLPFDNDEGLTKACRENGMENIPVAAPSMAPERLEKLAAAGFKYIYAALRAGITGTNTTIDENTLSFLKNVSAGGSKVYGGFGISNGEQSAALASSVEAVVAGSVFVRLIAQYKDDADLLSKKITEKAREITCS